MSDTIFLGGLLALAGGFMDSYSYIARGGVFANAQTGNIVLFGINIFNHNIKRCLLYLISIISFVIGVIITECIKSKFKKDSLIHIHWRQIIILTEIVILFLVGYIYNNSIANILISLVCSLQVQTFRKVNDLACATTMCTGNLRIATENLFKYISTHDSKFLKNGLQYYGIICIFIFGAIIGALATNYLDIKAIWLACGILFVTFILMLYNPK